MNVKMKGNKNKNIFKYSIILSVFVFTFFIFVNNSSAAEIVPGTGLVTYGDGASLSWATLTTTGVAGAVKGVSASISLSRYGNPIWTVTKTSPTRKESLVGILDTNGKFNMLRYNGTAWSLEWTENRVGSTSLDTRAFHIAYETSSSSAGEAVVAWAKAKGTAGGAAGVQDNGFEYRVWDGTNWGASNSYDFTLSRASVSWVEMWSHPATGSNQSDITACYATGRSPALTATFPLADTAVGCLVWDGATNTWGNEKRVESDGMEVTIPGESHTFSGFYEQGSGDFIATSGVEAVAGGVLTTWNGTSWTATASFSTTTGDTFGILDCASMPWISGVTNNQAACEFLFDAASDDINAVDWTGSAGGTDASLDAAALSVSLIGRLGVASTWLVNGATRVGVVAIADADSVVDFSAFDESGAGTWGAAQAGPTTPDSATNYNFSFDSNPYDKGKAVLLVIDSTGDLQIYKASASGTTILSGIVNTNVSLDNAFIAGMPAAFSYYNYASPTFSHFRWYNDDGAPGSTTAISAEDIKASGSEALGIGSTYRLRTQLSNEGPASISNDKFRLEFTKANTSCLNGGLSPGWSWRTVPLSAILASDAFDIEADIGSAFTDGAAITSGDSGITDGDPTFVNGAAYDAVATTSAFTLSGNDYTEFEWNLTPNSNAQVNATYCFRLGRIEDTNPTPDFIGSMSYGKIASASVKIADDPTFTQNRYQWRYNVDNVDPGAAVASENTAADITNTQIVRLRMNVTVATSAMNNGTQAFKLKYGPTSSGPWTDVGSTTSFNQWKFYENPSVAHGTTLANLLPLTGSDVKGLYMASNSMPTNPLTVAVGQDVEYDFSLDPIRADAGKSYYFRMFKSDDAAFSGQNNHPQINIVGNSPSQGGGGGSSDSGGGGSGQSGGGAGGGGGGSGGGGSGAFTFVQSNFALNDSSGTTLGVTLNGVTAGNLIVIWAKHEGDGAVATTISGSDATTSLSPGNYIQHSVNVDQAGQFLYLLSANGGNKTYTVTWGTARPWRRILIAEFSYTGTATLDTQNGSSGTGTTVNSGNITTTGAGSVVIGSFGEYAPGSTTVESINGSSADGVVDFVTPITSMWYKIFSSTFTNGAATATVGSMDWISGIIAFKATFGGEGSSGGGSAQSGGGAGGGGGASPVMFLGW